MWAVIVVVVFEKGAGNFGSGTACDDGGCDGEELRCCDAFEGLEMGLADQDEGEGDCDCDRGDTVYHPEDPGECCCPGAPVGATEEDEAFYDGCEAHGYGAEEEAVGWIVDHYGPYLGVCGVSYD